MSEIEEIKREINLIKERNQRVEIDKAWETSIFRIVFVLIMTYIITAVVFYFIGINNFLLNALIPAVGFYLSTQSLPFIKKWWIDKFYKKN